MVKRKKKKVAKKKKKVAKKKKKVAKKKKKAPKKKKKKAAKRGKKAFGGYTICFKNASTPLVKVFGTGRIAPSAMTKKLWAYVKRHKLNK
jgi:chromatin remodeling complex protein RSC6